MAGDEGERPLAPDPSPVGEGGRAAAGWGGRRTKLSVRVPRILRKRMTPHEVKLWTWPREQMVAAGFHMRRQVPIDCYVVDFACLPARLVIELDGAQHGSVEGLRADGIRDTRLAELGYEVLRFSNHAIDHEKPSVLDAIYAALARRHAAEPHPCGASRRPPSPAGEGSGVEPFDAKS